MCGYSSKLWCSTGVWVTLIANFRGKGGRPSTTLGVRKLESLGLSRGVVCVILRLAVLIQYRRVTDTQTYYTMTANIRASIASRGYFKSDAQTSTQLSENQLCHTRRSTNCAEHSVGLRQCYDNGCHCKNLQGVIAPQIINCDKSA